MSDGLLDTAEAHRLDMLKVAREFQVGELTYRRTHRWNVFTWAASLLIGTTSIVAVFSQKLSGITSLPVDVEKVILIIGAVVLVWISIDWMGGDFDREHSAKQIINEIDKCGNLDLYKGIVHQETESVPNSSLHHHAVFALVALTVVLGISLIFAT